MTDRAAHIERLRSFPDELEALVNPLSDAQLDARPLDGEWTIREIVHHLADSHMNANWRFKKPLTEANPTLPEYDQDAITALADYQLPLTPSLMILRGLHSRFVAILESLTAADFAHTGVHSEWGTVTVEAVLRRYAEHCDNHLEQIKRTLAAPL